MKKGFLDNSDGKDTGCNAGDSGSIPGSGRREWQPTPVLLTGESHGQTMGSQKVGHDWATNTFTLFVEKVGKRNTHTHTHTHTRIHLFVVVDSKFICWSLTPNVTVFGEKTFKEIICESRSWEWGSIQYGWCPYKKRRTPGVHIHREGPRVGTGEEGCLQAKEKGFRRNQPCPHLGLRL